MPITGLSFLLFALAAVVLYYLFPKRLRQYVLLAASILFYLTYGVRMAGYLAATILLTYLFGLWLDRLAAFRPAAETKEERKRQKRANDRKKRRVLALSLVLNFASLSAISRSWCRDRSTALPICSRSSRRETIFPGIISSTGFCACSMAC